MSSSSASLFQFYFRQLSAGGLDLDGVLWVVPRIESAAELKRQWQVWKGGKVMATPPIQTADRLSHPVAGRPWLNLQAQLAGILRRNVELTRGLSQEQVWSLAAEYLNYAMRIHMAQSARPVLQQYKGCGPYSEREAEVILQIAQAWDDEFRALTLKPQEGWAKLEGVVWFNDGEDLPRHWLASYLPTLPVHEISLPLVQGPEPWQALALGMKPDQTHLAVASDLHAQCQQAAALVCEWLRQDPESEIAIAVSDRLAARRLVPVLETAGVLVDDRTGWRLSTSALAGWFHDLLAQYQASQGSICITHPFSRAPLAEINLECTPQPLAGWAQGWLSVLKEQGLLPCLQADEAGRLLLQSLRDFNAIGCEDLYSAQGFMSAWSHRTEQIRFRPLDVASPVRLLPLLSTRLRGFERVLVLGCAQSHFQESPPGLLPPGVLRDLGVSGAGLGRKQQISALHELIEHSSKLVLSHANTVGGQPEALLPELQYLDMLLRQQHGQANKGNPGSHWLYQFEDFRLRAEVREFAPLQINARALGVVPPQQLRVTALDDHAACPLRFGLSHVLPFTDVRAQSEDNFFQLRGIFVHQVLEAASTQMQGSGSIKDFNAWKQPLEDAMSSVFLSMSESDQARIYPFLDYFSSLIPRVAGALAERAGHGWQLAQTEATLTGSIRLADGHNLRLQGRADRIESRGPETAIVDIKFRDPKVLRNEAKVPLEHPQLPVYQQLLGRGQTSLEYFGIHKNGVEWVTIAPPEDDEEHATWGEALWANLAEDLVRFFNGESWSQRPGKACTYCKAFGICRPPAAGLDEQEEDEL